MCDNRSAAPFRDETDDTAVAGLVLFAITFRSCFEFTCDKVQIEPDAPGRQALSLRYVPEQAPCQVFGSIGILGCHLLRQRVHLFLVLGLGLGRSLRIVHDCGPFGMQTAQPQWVRPLSLIGLLMPVALRLERIEASDQRLDMAAG